MSQNKKASLPPAVIAVTVDQGTEPPFSGDYTDLETRGSYLCRQCGLALFRSHDKFSSTCGWPSFDDAVLDTVVQRPDRDGRRTEIICRRCAAHLGHIFVGEGYTHKNARYCVNSCSVDFVADTQVLDTEEAIVAGGCFWGIEYYFQKLPGVLKTEVGYCGGTVTEPTYTAVCTGKTGHLEATRVVFDKHQIEYAHIIRYFFEIHDPAQSDGQGPDIGPQYLSAIFYYDQTQLITAKKIMTELKNKNYLVKTKLLPMSVFWRAESHHQNYYRQKSQQPYCHRWEKKF